jgi:beta-mannosidase
VSDRTASFKAALRTRLYAMAGKRLSESSKPVEAAALSSTSAGEFSDAELLHGANPTSTVASFDVIENGEVIAHHLLYFGLAKTLALPTQPGLSADWHQVGNDVVVTVRTKQLARGVWLDLGNIDAELSDNAFDLLPGEHVDITIKSAVDVSRLKAALKLTSLVDAVQAQAKP